MYPNWILILFVLIGILGMTIGLSVLRGKKRIQTGYLHLLGLITIGLIMNFAIMVY